MKKQVLHLYLLAALAMCVLNVQAQVKIGDNETTILAGSLLELESTDKALTLPRMTAAQMDAIPSPVDGMVIYNTSDSCVYQHNRGNWNSLCTDDFCGTILFDSMNPNTGTPTFTPNDPENSCMLYFSTVDLSTWIWNPITNMYETQDLKVEPWWNVATRTPSESLTDHIYHYGSANVGTGHASGSYSMTVGNLDTVSGTGSLAAGVLNKVSGNNSAALGSSNLVSGGSSMSFGNFNTVSGSQSIAGGSGNEVTSVRSVVIGLSNAVRANQSIAVGLRDTITAVSSAAFGADNTVNGKGSIVAGGYNRNGTSGFGNVNSGNSSLVTGINNELLVNHSIVAGRNNKASSQFGSQLVVGNFNKSFRQDMIVAGESNWANSEHSIVSGLNNAVGSLDSTVTNQCEYNLVTGRRDTVITGSGHIAGGIDNTVSSNYTFAVGQANTVSGASSAVWGNSNIVTGAQSTACGSSNTVSGTNSSVIAGTGLTASADNTAYANAIVINSGTVGGSAITSDARLKTNIVSNPYGLEAIMSLRPVEYDKKMKLSGDNYNRHEIGFIAQEIKKVIPSIVDTATNAYAEDILAVDYNSLIPVLTKAIQEQQAQIESLKAQLATAQASATTASEEKEALAQQMAAMQQNLALILTALQANGVEVQTAAK